MRGCSVNDETKSDFQHRTDRGVAGGPTAGVVVVFSGEQSCFVPIPLEHGLLEIDRNALKAQGVVDERCSRQHARIKRSGGLWSVRDGGSKNGTFVNGQRVESEQFVGAPYVVRVGGTLLLLLDRLEDLEGGVERGGEVVGPRLRALREQIERLARAGQGPLLLGETGTGKEVAARWFHTAGQNARGPFVAVNCAAVPKELAERLFFGSVRGAFSGSTDSVGYAQAADEGTLFLDEIGELDLAVQAKLLRLLESREVTPLGGHRSRTVDVRVVSATHRSLREDVRAGRFRADLFFRLAQPELTLPPLRERREEIPALVELALSSLSGQPPGVSWRPSVTLVEQAMLQAWPGNLRELLAVVRVSAALQPTPGKLSELHLPAAATSGEIEEASEPAVELEPGQVEAALRETRGSVKTAAERLGVSRARLRRYLERQRIDPDRFR